MEYWGCDDAVIVVGGNSLVGGGLAKVCEEEGIPLFRTTRRPEEVGGDWLYLDFLNAQSYGLPTTSGPVVIVAAATDYARCESDPEMRAINEDAIPQLTQQLLSQGARVTLVSSNSVFGGDIPWPDEHSVHNPKIAYARQKSICERKCIEEAGHLGALDRLTIVRLTKILDMSVSPLPMWMSRWNQGLVVQPFADLIFAPMSLRFVSRALVAIVESKQHGVFHLSGKDNVSYVEFAEVLATMLGVPASLVQPTSAADAGVSIPFMPRYSGLAMNVTHARLGLVPQPLSSVVDDLYSEIEDRPASQRNDG